MSGGTWGTKPPSPYPMHEEILSSVLHLREVKDPEGIQPLFLL